MGVCNCGFCSVCVCVMFVMLGVCIFLNHLLPCMFHYYGVILHALMFTFTYYLLLSTHSIYSLVPSLSCQVYTLLFVQLFVNSLKFL